MKNIFIKKLIEMLESSDLDSIQISSFWGMNKIKLFKSSPSNNSQLRHNSNTVEKNVVEDSSSHIITSESLTDKQDKVSVIKESKNEEELEHSTSEENTSDGYHEICAPLVGTFYGAPKEEDPPFIQPGDKISEGQVFCIIEAMKIFNEIESEVSGTVKEILVDNASPVEYGQPIVLIDTDV